jgi:CRISPR-associated protein Csb2
VLRRRAQQVTQDQRATYAVLTADGREQLSLIAGKDGNGRPLDSHRHAYFAVWPDENGQASRLICFRNSPFTPDEVEAILASSEQPFTWDFGSDEWQVRLVPLPFDSPLPSQLVGPSAIWRSVSAFVPPRGRRRVRRHGRSRPGETPPRLVSKLLQKCGFPEPISVSPKKEPWESEWVYIHATFAERQRLRDGRMRPVQVGYHCQIEFAEPVSGPVCIGDSSHFGLGLFAAVDD